MSNVDVGLVGQHLTRIDQLATKAQSGQDVSGELGAAVAEAVDHFGRVFNPAAQLDEFIGQLRFKADRARENQPAYTEILERAAVMASKPSTGA